MPIECLFECKRNCHDKPFDRYSARRPLQPVCKCGKGYGSTFDGLCTSCRGQTAWAAQHPVVKPAWGATSAEGFTDVED